MQVPLQLVQTVGLIGVVGGLIGLLNTINNHRRQMTAQLFMKYTERLREAAPHASSTQARTAGVESAQSSHRTHGFRVPSRLHGGRKALDLAAVLKRKIRPAFEKVGITGVGWHTFRHTAGTVLAELGEHQLTIRDYLRHSNLSVTNKYLQAASKTKRNAQAKLVEAILPVHLLAGKSAEELAP